MKKESVYKTLWSRIKKGQSFVGEGSRVSSWLFASDPHGTQMANLICAIDPWCDLYVAKVTEGRSGIIPVRAIQWAMDQGVDIISMSFAILEHTNSLEDICKEAARRGIIMLCSTHDEGFNVTKAYPADFSDTITITACDEFGAVAQTMSQEYRYSIQGHEVAAGVVPFLESSDRISGSSVATAIAAGLSSLVLSCDRLARNDDDFKQVTRKTIITKQFGMMASDNTKYLILGKFAGIDAKIRDGTEINARSIIKEFFKSVTYGDP
ncbi:uncharacterized protein TRIVIDRAFT_153866 [Trichoderma virens Gv29-8]|uniref:Peptidase S8/S53 domain-containing protein n=1 Tax=Hypocrea virens (strain Gv29-8 / FGSC 10586) TaxID=413071 RepID=G9MXU6_HYPVG|nr:uncharacterized protein TRIVIDRAFT_153866 [Trichoderma virens Gv29-8]EHK20707.1 hypothetical protein TRIVIDRAFT_153866 [Trichoderma virens Gv29-8]